MGSKTNRLSTNKNEFFLISFARHNFLLAVAWIACIILVGLYSLQRELKPHFMGITEAYQYRVQFENPVTVDEVLVTSGQEVAKGQALLRLTSSKVETELTRINLELASKNSQYQLTDKKKSSLIDLEKRSLSANANFSLLETELLSLIKMKKIIKRQQDALKVSAPYDGYIGQLNFSTNEAVPPFNPLLFVSEKSAKIVRSYLLESEQDAFAIRVGQEVNIYKQNGSFGGSGKVFQIGSEVIALPPRFQKTGFETIYGRAFLIQATPETKFLIGERVSVEFNN